MLAELRNFVADKEVDVEGSTLRFFSLLGQEGLATAVWMTNARLEAGWRHTWLPNLSIGLLQPALHLVNRFEKGWSQEDVEWIKDAYKCREIDAQKQLQWVHFEVMEDGKLKLSCGWWILEVELRFGDSSREEYHGESGAILPLDLQGVLGKPSNCRAFEPGYHPRVPLASMGLARLMDRRSEEISQTSLEPPTFPHNTPTLLVFPAAMPMSPGESLFEGNVGMGGTYALLLYVEDATLEDIVYRKIGSFFIYNHFKRRLRKLDDAGHITRVESLVID